MNEVDYVGHAADVLGMDRREILAAKVDEESPVLVVVTVHGQKIRLTGRGARLLVGPKAPPRTLEAPPLPSPEEQPDELLPLVDDDAVGDADPEPLDEGFEAEEEGPPWL